MSFKRLVHTLVGYGIKRNADMACRPLLDFMYAVFKLIAITYMS